MSTPMPEITAQLQERIRCIVQSCRTAHNVRACLLATRDRDHALSLLKTALTDGNTPLYHFSVVARRYFEAQKLSWQNLSLGDREDTVYSLLDEAQRLPQGGVVMLEDCVSFLRDEKENQRERTLLARMLSAETRSEGLLLIFIEPPEAKDCLPTILKDQFVHLDIPYPRVEELERIARQEITVISSRTGSGMNTETIQRQAGQLAPELVGLTRTAARDALWDALAREPRDNVGAYRRLAARKAEHLSQQLGMNVLDTTGVEEPVGLENLVEYLRVAQDKMRVAGPERARGILLIGPPGTGKTMLARAIGKLVELPVVEFRISAMMNSLLGYTERRFAEAFEILESMAPNIVFIDEIEKAFGDSSERDGGTMMRCTGALLSWLSDNPYPNFIVATSNSLRRMGEIGLTMTRSERFDTAFFVDVPGYQARRSMLTRWLSGHLPDPAAVAGEMAGLTENFSGADLRSIVKQSLALARYDGQPLTIERLRDQACRKQARAHALYEEFRELRQWGQRYCEPAALTMTEINP